MTTAWLGVLARGVHTSAAASGVPSGAAPAADVVTHAASAAAPSAVTLKVADGGASKYANCAIEWDRLKDMRAGELLRALAADEPFERYFEDVNLSACTVTVVKNATLPPGAVTPFAGQDEGDNVLVVKDSDTVGSIAAAARTGMPGAPLFIRVDLPAVATDGE